MSDESADISSKTWSRNVDVINRIGYSDGFVQGQSETFQSSFDVGYAQGLQFGIDLGLREANNQQNNETDQLHDPRRINCQICIGNNTDRENIVNLYNIQKEKNDDYLKTKD